MTERTTVLVADDHVLVRDCLKPLVCDALGEVQFLEAHDGSSLFEHLNESSATIQLALIDLRMPDMQGGTRLIELARAHPRVPIIVISALVNPELISRVALIPSVHAFVPKSGSSGNLRVAIEAAMQGRKVSFVKPTSLAMLPEPMLTPRQQEIRDLMRQGLTNKRIARTLGISTGTVKNHLTEIFRTLRATNRTQAAQIDAELE